MQRVRLLTFVKLHLPPTLDVMCDLQLKYVTQLQHSQELCSLRLQEPTQVQELRLRQVRADQRLQLSRVAMQVPQMSPDQVLRQVHVRLLLREVQ